MARLGPTLGPTLAPRLAHVAGGDGVFTILLAAHGLSTGDGVLTMTTTGALPVVLALATPYYAIVIDPDHLNVADSYAHAMAGTPIVLTDAGTGVHTLVTGAAVHLTPITFSHTFTIGSTPGNTVYDVRTMNNLVGDVNTVIQAALSTGADYTPVDAFDFDEPAADTCSGCDDGPSVQLVSSVPTVVVTVASPHGGAAPQLADGSAYWSTDNTVFAFTTEAFAFAVRIKITAKPGAQYGFIGRGSSASAHYRMSIDASGFPAMAAKQAGGEDVATVAADITDGAWRWLIGGRTVTGQLLWLTLVDGSAAVAFPAARDLTNGGAVFGLWPGVGGIGVGIACEIDHLIGWSGAAAENVYTNRAALLTVLGAAPADVIDQFVTFAGAHSLEDGDGAFRASTTVTLPGGIPAATDLWGIATGHGATELGLADSYAHAIAGTPLTLTSSGAGVQTLDDNATAVHSTAVALADSPFTVID